MKKHLIAAAVAGAFAVPAMAQVTISGSIDVGQFSQKTSQNQTDAAIGSSTKTSGVGFVGEGNGWTTPALTFAAREDLGGGLSVAATLTTFYSGTAGTNNLIGGGERSLTLRGGFGSIKAGRFVPAVHGWTAFAVVGGTNRNPGNLDRGGFDLSDGSIARPWTASTAAKGPVAPEAATLAAAGTISLERQNNVLEYTSPVMNGFSVSATFIESDSDRDGTTQPSSTRVSQTGFGVGYSQGPLTVRYALGKNKTSFEGTTAINAAQQKADLQWIGASYNLGVATVFLLAADRDDSRSVNGVETAAERADVKVNSVGLSVPLGATTLHASTYKGKNTRGTAAESDMDLKGYQIGARYSLSKRTFAYAVTGRNENNRKNTGLNGTDTKQSGTSIGLVHTF